MAAFFCERDNLIKHCSVQKTPFRLRNLRRLIFPAEDTVTLPVVVYRIIGEYGGEIS